MEGNIKSVTKGQFALPGPSVRVKHEIIESYGDTFIEDHSSININLMKVQNMKKEKLEIACVENYLSEMPLSNVCINEEQHHEKISEVKKVHPLKIKAEPRFFDGQYKHSPIPIPNFKDLPCDLPESLSELDEVSNETMQIFAAEKISVSDFLAIDENSETIDGVVQPENVSDVVPPILSYFPDNLSQNDESMERKQSLRKQVSRNPDSDTELNTVVTRQHTESKSSFPCYLCGKHFPSMELHGKHLKTHSAIKSLKCVLCGNIFEYKHSLSEHLSRVHNINKSSRKQKKSQDAEGQRKPKQHKLRMTKLLPNALKVENFGSVFTLNTDQEKQKKQELKQDLKSKELQQQEQKKQELKQDLKSKELQQELTQEVRQALKQVLKQEQVDIHSSSETNTIMEAETENKIKQVQQEQVQQKQVQQKQIKQEPTTEMIQDPSSCFSVEPGLSNLPYQNINGEFLSSRTKSLYEFIDTSKMPVEVADGISEDSKSRDSVPAEGEDGDGVALPATRGGSYIYDTGTENNKYNEYNKFYNENYYLKKIKQEENDEDEEEENIGKRSWCNGTKVYQEDKNDEDLEQPRKRSWCIGTKVYTEGNTDGHLEKTRKRSCCYGKKVYKEVDDDERQNRVRRYHKGNKDYTYNYKGTKDRNESFRIKFNFKRPEKVYYCSHCSFECKTMRELEQHKSVHRKVYKCSHCSFECKTKGAFEKHKSVHPNEKSYKCRYCSFECSQKPPVELHELKHDEYTPLAETKRKRQYETQYRRRKIAKFTCSRCNYSTDLKHRFQIHNISHYSTNVLRKKVMKQMNYISSKIS